MSVDNYAEKNINVFDAEDAVRYLSSYIDQWVWLSENDKKWAKIVSYRYDTDDCEFKFQWEQYDEGPDITELWDDGEFSLSDIGETVFFGEEARQKANEWEDMYYKLAESEGWV